MNYKICLQTTSGIEHTLTLSQEKETSSLSRLIPLMQSLCTKILEIELADCTISCKKGCSSCCAQLVPLSIPETFYLERLVEELPGQHKKRVKQRFALIRITTRYNESRCHYRLVRCFVLLQVESMVFHLNRFPLLWR